MSEKMMCDFALPSHPIQEGDGIIVTFAEVSTYAEAYAEMTIEDMTHTITGRQILQYFGVPGYKLSLINFAGGGDSVFWNKKQTLIIRNKTDWICCPLHHKRWEEWKQKFPAKGN